MENEYLEKFLNVLCQLKYWHRETKKEITLLGKILKIENEFISFMVYEKFTDFMEFDIDKSGELEIDSFTYQNEKFIVTGLKKIFKNDLREIQLFIFHPKKDKGSYK